MKKILWVLAVYAFVLAALACESTGSATGNSAPDYVFRPQSYDQALAAFAAGIMPADEAAPYFLDRGKDFYGQGKFDEAIQAFNVAIAADENLAEAYAGRGNAYLQQGDLDRANADFEAFLRIDPKR